MHTGKIYDAATAYTPPSPRTKKPFVMTQRYEDILEAVHYYRYVRTVDITRLFYAESSSNHVRETLALLAGKSKQYPGLKYLYRFPLPTTRIGQTEHIYTLGSAGRRYMGSLGADVSWQFRPAKHPHADAEAVYDEIAMSYMQLKHDIILTSFMVAAVSFGCSSAEWRLHDHNIQYGLKRAITALCTSDEEKGWLRYAVPDGFLDFHHNKKTHVPLLVEIDRAREYKQAFKQRIRGLVTFLENGIYTRLFGKTLPRIGFATIGGDDRLAHMRLWTKEVVQELRRKPLRRAFYFRRLQSSSWEHDAQSLLCSSHWFSVGNKTPSPLLG